MSQYKDIPQPTDQRNVSQNDILTNYRYLSTPLGVAGGVPNGIIPVDHFATGDNVANPTDGFHKQISFQDRATPANLTNAVNGQNSSSIEYTKTDGAGASQIRFKNSSFDAPVTYLKAMVMFNDTGAIIGNSFNVASVVKNSSGNFTITFSVAMFNTNYMVNLGFHSNNVPRVFLGDTVTKNLGSFIIQEFQLVAGVPLATGSADLTNVFVYGLF